MTNSTNNAISLSHNVITHDAQQPTLGSQTRVLTKAPVATKEQRTLPQPAQAHEKVSEQEQKFNNAYPNFTKSRKKKSGGIFSRPKILEMKDRRNYNTNPELVKRNASIKAMRSALQAVKMQAGQGTSTYPAATNIHHKSTSTLIQAKKMVIESVGPWNGSLIALPSGYHASLEGSR